MAETTLIYLVAIFIIIIGIVLFILSRREQQKGKTWIYGIIGGIIVIIFIVAIIAVGSYPTGPQTANMSIVSHSAIKEFQIMDVFYGQVNYTVKNSGTVGGNATVICKIMLDSQEQSFSKIYYLNPGQSKSGSWAGPLTGNGDGYWTYQCYVLGENPQTWVHN